MPGSYRRRDRGRHREAVVVEERVHGGGPPLAVSAEDVRGVVEGLYADEATPHEALVQWRLKCRLGVDVPVTDIRAAAEASSGFRIEAAWGARHSMVIWLARSPSWFTGFVDTADETSVGFSDEQLHEAQDLLLKGGWPQGHSANHEKYNIASWLGESTGALATLTFGKLLNLVGNLVQTKGVLGKRDKRLVPYPASEDFEKQQNALRLMPTGLRPGEAYVRNWDELVTCMVQLLQDSGGKIAPPRLKPLFRSTFRLELSETALGHTSLSSLLRDEKFVALFSVWRSEKTTLEQITAKEGVDLQRWWKWLPSPQHTTLHLAAETQSICSEIFWLAEEACGDASRNDSPGRGRGSQTGPDGGSVSPVRRPAGAPAEAERSPAAAAAARPRGRLAPWSPREGASEAAAEAAPEAERWRRGEGDQALRRGRGGGSEDRVLAEQRRAAGGRAPCSPRRREGQEATGGLALLGGLEGCAPPCATEAAPAAEEHRGDGGRRRRPRGSRNRGRLGTGSPGRSPAPDGPGAARRRSGPVQALPQPDPEPETDVGSEGGRGLADVRAILPKDSRPAVDEKMLLPKLGFEPFKLPAWCCVRRTFIEASISEPIADRAFSSPPPGSGDY